jgi:hypothetical protein
MKINTVTIEAELEQNEPNPDDGDDIIDALGPMFTRVHALALTNWTLDYQYDPKRRRTRHLFAVFTRPDNEPLQGND